MFDWLMGAGAGAAVTPAADVAIDQAAVQGLGQIGTEEALTTLGSESALSSLNAGMDLTSGLGAETVSMLPEAAPEIIPISEAMSGATSGMATVSNGLGETAMTNITPITGLGDVGGAHAANATSSITDTLDTGFMDSISSGLGKVGDFATSAGGKVTGDMAMKGYGLYQQKQNSDKQNDRLDNADKRAERVLKSNEADKTKRAKLNF